MMNPCVMPEPAEDDVGDGRWMSMHNRYVQEAKTSESEVLFIGDSIIQQLQFSTLWSEKISALHCMNFGIGGDRVENVLWRVRNGELDFNTKIKAVVLFVGTNNLDCTPHEIFEGILEIIKEIKNRLGNVAIILPTLLPKGQYPNPYRDRNDHVNTFLLDKFFNEANVDEVTENVHVVVIDGHIIGNDQTISHHIMHDYLHLTNSGYTKVFGKVYEKLCEILKLTATLKFAIIGHLPAQITDFFDVACGLGSYFEIHDYRSSSSPDNRFFRCCMRFSYKSKNSDKLFSKLES